MVTQIATREGSIAAAMTSIVWLPTTAFLAYGNSGPSHFFRTRLNTSARTALVIMPIVFAFGIVSEQVASRMANPEAFAHDIHSGRVSTLSLPKRLANFVHDYPVRTLFMLGVPGVIGIFASKGGQHELSLSQRLMHTRVIGQFTVLSILLGTMGFHDYMSRHGRYLEPWEEELLKKEEAGKQTL